MAWELSSQGFVMTLSGYIPELIEEDFAPILNRALGGESHQEVSHWCVHPGGKRILEAIERSLSLQKEQLQASYDVLHDYGNMSSATILFVLKRMMQRKEKMKKLAAAAFGPGLTVETFIAHS
jgi:predicted naringenin-chalcone synthase